jgi:aryl-alcohol dehydrogenase-like predicted oxidoreductase
MKYRRFGRTGWQVSEVGYGMWGMAGWTGSDDRQSLESLRASVERGVNFFDTAWAYGAGHSEKLLGQIVHAFPGKKLYAATKIPPKNLKWPARSNSTIEETYPPDHIRSYAEASLKNLGLDCVDLLQFHVWNDNWADDDRWQKAVAELREQGLIRACGISINRWEPENVVRALRTGLIDAVQVIYNIFDQAPEDVLFPLCRELDVAVIARVPFDEGTLTGTLTLDSKWPAGDWRNTYFVADNLKSSVARAEELRRILPARMKMPELAMRFILSCTDVHTVIPGMRKPEHVEQNTAASEAGPLPPALIAELRRHRWDRRPTKWSQ